MSQQKPRKHGTMLKAGGGQSSALQDRQVVREFTPTIARLLEGIFNDLVSSSGHQDSDEPPLTSYDQFMGWWQSPASAALAPPTDHDLSLPLCNYYISSSHNTYLSGNQLYGASTTESYTNVLLRGCRCLEIDVWNGEDETSSVSSSDYEDVDPEKSTTPRRKRAISKLKDLGGKAQDKLRRSSSKSPSKRSPDAHRRNKDVDQLTASMSATEIAERRAALKTEPRVYHGYTLTKQIPFREVCEAIRDAAFKASTLPVIVSLEVHCNLDQQQVMVEIMEETWKGHLIDMSGKSYDDIQSLPSPESLRNKILIKVKWTPTTSSEPNDPVEISGTAESDQMDGTALSQQSSQQKKAVKIIDALSKLGVYTRAYSFKSFQQPEAKIPTHVFSLDENKLGDIHSHPDHGPDMFQHNQNYLVRIYPSGVRVNSSNIDPAFSWRQGAQIVALNWQSLDKGMMLSEGMFAGEEGYVLKPDGFRSANMPGHPHPVRRRLNLTIKLLAGQNLPMPAEKDKTYADHLKPYVKFQLHVDTHGPPGQGKTEQSDTHGSKSKYFDDKNKQSAGEEKDEDERKLKRKTRAAKSANPDWDKSETMTWTDVPDVVEQLSFLRIKVKDDKLMARDDLCAWACIRLDRLKTGYRFLHLLDVEGEPSEGVLLVQIKKEVY
ncbi:hypothetical protein PMZ80_006737 [Knufia obscura]|uniref:Phosphoinositide phospholipase C n=2 Tax=Knufia TaxID=430999 RepID=A0AAN8I2A4_9EURO|nr:hypothetical protein PMZ80_006737 [Knufia obscura]KAK5948274.1 hypothetical protein OHC33_010708 [Knufia fluminis]